MAAAASAVKGAGLVRPAVQGEITISFTVPADRAPALRSAVEEISNEVGGRLEGRHTYAKEQALTDAAIGLGRLRAAVNKAVPAEDPHYR